MMPRNRLIGLILALGVLVFLAVVIPGCIRTWQSQRAQARTDNAQAGAARNSAADAIGTVAADSRRTADSEGMTRDNSRDIRNAPGAGDRVNAGSDLAGRKALCKRPAFKDDPKCAMFR